MGSVAIQQEQKVTCRGGRGCIGKTGVGTHGVPLGAHGGQAVHDNRTEEGDGHM